MKKNFIAFTLFLAATAMNAQTLITANFQKGDKATYENATSISMDMPMGGGSQNVKITNKLNVCVKEANAEGYQIEFLTTDVKVDGSKDVAMQIGDQISQFTDGVIMLFQTDKHGDIKKLLNYDDVVGKMSKAAIANIDSTYKANPELEKVSSKAKMIMALNDLFSEKNIIESVKEKSIFNLYGKTLKSGDKEDKEMQGLKTTVTYDVSNVLGMLSVVAKSQSNMAENDVKTYLIDNMKKMGLGEEVTSQIESNWGQMKAMGMTNIDLSGTDTYHFLKSGWVNDQTGTGKMKMMGMNMTIESTSKLVEHSWK